MTDLNNTNHEAQKTIIAFHIGRGGRFFNQGYKTFEGFKSITDVSDFDTLFLNEETKEWLSATGEEVVLTEEEANSGIGSIDIDGEYDTTYTTLLSDISSDELEVITRGDHWENERAIEILCDFYNCTKEDLEFEIQ